MWRDLQIHSEQIRARRLQRAATGLDARARDVLDEASRAVVSAVLAAPRRRLLSTTHPIDGATEATIRHLFDLSCEP